MIEAPSHEEDLDAVSRHAASSLLDQDKTASRTRSRSFASMFHLMVKKLDWGETSIS
jgi:hypothetical protein